MTSNIMLTLAFLAGVLAVYYLTPKAGRQWILLAASLLFYLSADPRMLLLSGGSALRRCWFCLYLNILISLWVPCGLFWEPQGFPGVRPCCRWRSLWVSPIIRLR